MTLERAKSRERTNPAKRSVAMWQESALNVIRSYSRGRAFTGDNLRKDAILSGVKQPGNNNAWGSVMAKANKLFLIRRTGRYLRSKTESSNGRMLAEWVRL